MFKKECEYCKKVFYPKTNQTKYCDNCRKIAYYEKQIQANRRPTKPMSIEEIEAFKNRFYFAVEKKMFINRRIKYLKRKGLL